VSVASARDSYEEQSQMLFIMAEIITAIEVFIKTKYAFTAKLTGLCTGNKIVSYTFPPFYIQV